MKYRVSSANSPYQQHATPTQRTIIAQSIARGNRLQKEIFENVLSLIFSTFIIYGTKELTARVPFLVDLITQWITRRAFENAEDYLKIAESQQPLFFRNRDLYAMYKLYQPVLLETNIEFNKVPYDVYIDVKPYYERIKTVTGTSDAQALELFKNVCMAAINKARNEINFKSLMVFCLIAPLIQTVFVEIVLERTLLRRIHFTNLWMRNLPRGYLTKRRANDLIKQLIQNNSAITTLEEYIFQGTRLFALLGILYFAHSIYYKSSDSSPIVVMVVASTLFNALKNTYLNFYSWRAEFSVQVALGNINKSFHTMLSDFGSCNVEINGTQLSECYISYYASSNDHQLPVSLVCRSVKDMLVKNNINVLDYDHSHVTIEAQSLETGASDKIKIQIQALLLQHKNIRTLRKQVETFFKLRSSEMHIVHDDDSIQAVISVHCQRDAINLESLSAFFPKCALDISPTVITITGNQPAKEIIFYGAGYQKNHPQTAPTSFVAGHETFPRTLFSKVKVPSSLSPALVSARLSTPTEIEIWRDGTLTYTSSQATVFPLEGRNKSYLTFALPIRLFPSEAAYKQVKQKVEEGRMASNSFGSQGLQLRPERVRDQTEPHGRFFLSHLRYKMIGKMGNVRVHARSIVNENNATLFKFCSYTPSTDH